MENKIFGISVPNHYVLCSMLIDKAKHPLVWVLETSGQPTDSSELYTVEL